MKPQISVDCDYQPDSDGLSQHRMFRVDMTLKAGTERPIEELSTEAIMAVVRDEIEERTAEMIAWVTKDPMATTEGRRAERNGSRHKSAKLTSKLICESLVSHMFKVLRHVSVAQKTKDKSFAKRICGTNHFSNKIRTLTEVAA